MGPVAAATVSIPKAHAAATEVEGRGDGEGEGEGWRFCRPRPRLSNVIMCQLDSEACRALAREALSLAANSAKALRPGLMRF
jgi:hypothetical protein